MWNLDASQRGVSAGYCPWLRSGACYYSTSAFYLDAVGAHLADTVPSTTAIAASGALGGALAVRPAFNLDLTAANNSAFIPIAPTDVTSTYDGTEQDYFNTNEAKKWYNEELFSSANANVKVEYLNLDGSALSTPKPIDSGEYKVKLTVQNSSKDRKSVV